MNDAMFEKIIKSFNDSGITAEEIFEKMENTVPLGGRCIDCVNRHNAIRGGANIFCSSMDKEYDYAIVTNYNASDCKHFKQKTEETDGLEKTAIKMLISEMC